LPVQQWADYFARNDVRVSPERGGIRISFAMFNTRQDVERLVNVISTGLRENTPRLAAQVD
jgi:cysteine desulfurase / selenocysteine lyase